MRNDLQPGAVRAAVANVLGGAATGALSLSRWTGEVLTVLFEPERAFVMEVAGPDYTGSVACDPRLAGERRPVAFTLSNGQVDRRPTNDMTGPGLGATATPAGIRGWR